MIQDKIGWAVFRRQAIDTRKTVLKLLEQKPIVERPQEQFEEVQESLAELGLLEHDQVREFFEKYRLGSVRSNQSTELLDLCSPTRQIIDTTEFGRDAYDLPDGHICLTSGEGQGFILYSLIDRKVYDLQVWELKELTDGKAEARWGSFYDLIEWYLK